MGKAASEQPVPPDDLPVRPPEGVSVEEWNDYRERYTEAWEQWVAERAERRARYFARRRRLRRRSLLIGVVVLPVLTGLGYFGYWYTELRQRYSVAVPPPDAAPTVVLSAWINAVNARDFATADALSTPDGRADARAWAGCASLRLLDLNVDGITYDTPTSANTNFLQFPDFSNATDIYIFPDIACPAPVWPFVTTPFNGQLNSGEAEFILTRSSPGQRWLVDAAPSQVDKGEG